MYMYLYKYSHITYKCILYSEHSFFADTIPHLLLCDLWEVLLDLCPAADKSGAISGRRIVLM